MRSSRYRRVRRECRGPLFASGSVDQVLVVSTEKIGIFQFPTCSQPFRGGGGSGRFSESSRALKKKIRRPDNRVQLCTRSGALLTSDRSSATILNRDREKFGAF